MKYGIFTKPIHVEKIVNFLNTTDINYVITTQKSEIDAYDIDIGVSYCWPWIVNLNYAESLAPSKTQWFNYHPGPLPGYEGPFEYATAIQNKDTEYGVTLHRMTSTPDGGPIIKVNKFKLDSVPVHTNELGTIAHYKLFQLFKETILSLQSS